VRPDVDLARRDGATGCTSDGTGDDGCAGNALVGGRELASAPESGADAGAVLSADGSGFTGFGGREPPFGAVLPQARCHCRRTRSTSPPKTPTRDSSTLQSGIRVPTRALWITVRPSGARIDLAVTAICCTLGLPAPRYRQCIENSRTFTASEDVITGRRIPIAFLFDRLATSLGPTCASSDTPGMAAAGSNPHRTATRPPKQPQLNGIAPGDDDCGHRPFRKFMMSNSNVADPANATPPWMMAPAALSPARSESIPPPRPTMRLSRRLQAR
jgi:hypothetical protein